MSQVDEAAAMANQDYPKAAEKGEHEIRLATFRQAVHTLGPISVQPPDGSPFDTEPETILQR